MKRVGGVFEGRLILHCTLWVVSNVEMSQSGRLVTLCHKFFSQYNALLVMNYIGIQYFLLVCNLLETLFSGFVLPIYSIHL